MVDDEKFIHMGLGYMLTKLNLKFDTANNGKEGFQKVEEKYYEKECCQFYNLFFMDYNMPECNGLESSKLIKEFLI